MGMFDSFLVNNNCQSCGDHIYMVQSKMFNCNLDIYEIGDAINQNESDYIESGYITENNYCSCNAKTKIFIKDGKYSSYELLKEKENEQIRN